MSGYREYMAKNARLIILKSLAAERDYRLNDTMIAAALDTFGHRLSREAVRTHLRLLLDLGAVELTEAGSVLIATITRQGKDHVEMRGELEGVAQPSPEG